MHMNPSHDNLAGKECPPPLENASADSNLTRNRYVDKIARLFEQKRSVRIELVSNLIDWFRTVKATV